MKGNVWPLLAGLILIVASSGCINISPETIALANPLIQQFMEDYPNAEVVVTYLNQEDAASYIDMIRTDCGNPYIDATEMYRVIIIDSDSGLNATVWLNWEEKTVECAIKYGNQTEINNPPDPGCNSHASHECYAGQVYWYDSCEEVEEVKQYCSNGCENGECKSSCTSHHEAMCYNGHVYWYNSCGSREEKKKACIDGCEAGACLSGDCTDSDGGKDYYEKGTTSLGSTTKKDSCYAISASPIGVTEYYCENNEIKSINHECPPFKIDDTAFYCKNGACVDEVEDNTNNCTDSDSGTKYDIKGTTKGKTSLYSEIEEFTDSCKDDNTLEEYFCGQFYIGSWDYDCPNGCEDGVCITENCRTHHETKCYANDLYWYDSCGTKEEKKVECPEGCENETCIVMQNEVNIIKIADGSYMIAPDIYDNKVVWYHRENSTKKDIFMYNLETETENKITDDEHSQGVPKIYGNYIIWRGNREGKYELFLYDIRTDEEKQLTFNTTVVFSTSKEFYAIHGNNIIYADGLRYNDSGDYVPPGIYIYNIETEISENIASDTLLSRIDIYGNKVVYISYNGSMDSYILHLYDIISKEDTILKEGMLGTPSIYGNRVVFWQTKDDIPDGDYDIHIINIETLEETVIESISETGKLWM